VSIFLPFLLAALPVVGLSLIWPFAALVPEGFADSHAFGGKVDLEVSQRVFPGNNGRASGGLLFRAAVG
jgi:hypothetical protein